MLVLRQVGNLFLLVYECPFSRMQHAMNTHSLLSVLLRCVPQYVAENSLRQYDKSKSCIYSNGEECLSPVMALIVTP